MSHRHPWNLSPLLDSRDNYGFDRNEMKENGRVQHWLRTYISLIKIFRIEGSILARTEAFYRNNRESSVGGRMSLRVFEIEIDTSKSFRIFISREKSCLRNFSLSQQTENSVNPSIKFSNKMRRETLTFAVLNETDFYVVNREKIAKFQCATYLYRSISKGFIWIRSM